jgi:hypothetical protein
MPPTIYANRMQSEAECRESIYAGNFHLITGNVASMALVRWIHSLLRETFAELDPQLAQYSLPVAEFVRRVGSLKSKFTNESRTRGFCRDLIISLGCRPDETYFDLPRLRVVPAGGYLTTGVSYAYMPHRDTWYAQPPMMVNYWIPVFDVVGQNVMSFWPGYWGKSIANTGFDYDEWVREHRNAAVHQIGVENRPHPVPTQPIDESREIRIALNAADITMFSTCHLHGTANNTSGRTRYSYDLRTLNISDFRLGRGPHDIDSSARGSTLGDFLRVSDLEPLDLEALHLKS